MLTLSRKNLEQKRPDPEDIICKRRTLCLSKKTYVMGVLNRTPDSFSDGGVFLDEDKAVRHAEEMVRDGADIIDIGGESTKPGSEPVSVKEELARVIPIIKRIAQDIDVPISIDTQKSEVAEAAIEAGASIINDVTALRGDERMKSIVAKYGTPIVLMHMKGTPKTMQIDPEYHTLISEIISYLKESIGIAKEAGIPEGKIIIDPGIGFGKTTGHNLSVIRNLNRFKTLGRPILVGVSRKSFIGKILNSEVNDRLMGTAASVAISILNGANIVRVHDVKPMVEIARIADAIRFAE